MGGTWGLWYALARPDRVRGLALLGSAPLLPGTRVPAPLRVAASPVIGDVLARVPKPTPRMVVRLLSSMGEGETIVRYPDLIESVAGGRSRPARRGDESRRVARVHHPVRVPAVGAAAPGRTAAAERADAADLG